ncbi:hypothetical protein BDN72DRAFT_377205 [Pluteus cervinus]|uniref:Uncharacterized protein n=1 Tax=Pluteus cervinus TaxID=181527 RepID=A0ACD3AA02_9AGAR|nr:hypothetical protein BDN72DRAFT_377205 [Pluteus cervinus]
MQLSWEHSQAREPYQFLDEVMMPNYPFLLDTLTGLDVNVTNTSKARLIKILDTCHFNLCCLKLELENAQPFLPRSLAQELTLFPETWVDLSSLNSLKSLAMSLDFEQTFHAVDERIRFRSMINILSSLKSSALQVIDIFFSLYPDDIEKFHWEDMDDVLHRIAQENPSLQLQLSS